MATMSHHVDRVSRRKVTRRPQKWDGCTVSARQTWQRNVMEGYPGDRGDRAGIPAAHGPDQVEDHGWRVPGGIADSVNDGAEGTHRDVDPGHTAGGWPARSGRNPGGPPRQGRLREGDA